MSQPAQPSYPGPQGLPGGPVTSSRSDGRPPGRGMKKAGLILLIIGLVVLMIGVVVLVLSILGVVRVATDVSDNATTFSRTTTVRLEGGEDLQAYVHEGESSPGCSITGADGDIPQTGTITQSSSVTVGGADWESFGSFTPSTTQDYTMSCETSQEVMIAPPVSIGGIVGGVGGILAGVFVGLVGILLAVTGLILLLVGRSRMKRAVAGVR